MQKRNDWFFLSLLLGLSACASSPDATQADPHRATLRAQSVPTYYIDSVSGDDGAAGTSSSSPWKTLAKLNARTFAPGDVLSFKRGSVFSGTVLSIKDAGVTLDTYGNGNTPVFENPGALKVLDITASNVTVDGLAFNDTAVFSTFGDTEYRNSGAVLIEQNADNVTVKNSEFSNVGLGVKSYGASTTLTGNFFHDLKIAYRDADQSYGAVGVSLNNSSATVSYNRFVNCRSTDSPYGADGGAIEIEGYDNQKNDINIHHNTSSGSQGFIEVTETSSSNVIIAQNLSDDYQHFLAFDTTTAPSRYRVEHNTIIRTHSENAVNIFTILYYREVVATPSDSWLSIRNNIFYAPAAKVLRGTYTYTDYNFPHDHNLYYDGGNDPLGYTPGVGDTVGDPNFIGSTDYHLAASSPAIDIGVGLGYNSDLGGAAMPVGAAPDAGAYEFQGIRASNLLGDPGFEGSSSLTSPWFTESGGSDGFFGVDAGAGQSRSGANNAWVTTGGPNWNALKQSVTVAANTDYTLSGWVRNSGNFSAGYFGVKTTGGTVLKEVQHGSVPGYTQYSVNFNSGTNTVVVVHSGYYGPGASSWQQLDDASLVRQ